jgi:hypothetical protein
MVQTYYKVTYLFEKPNSPRIFLRWWKDEKNRGFVEREEENGELFSLGPFHHHGLLDLNFNLQWTDLNNWGIEGKAYS